MLTHSQAGTASSLSANQEQGFGVFCCNSCQESLAVLKWQPLPVGGGPHC